MKRVLSIASRALRVRICGVTGRAGARRCRHEDRDRCRLRDPHERNRQLNGVLNKSIKGGDAAEAGKAAARMEVLFKNVHAYWADKKVADATTAAQTAVTSLQAVSEGARRERHGRRRNRARQHWRRTAWAATRRIARRLPEGGFKMK